MVFWAYGNRGNKKDYWGYHPICQQNELNLDHGVQNPTISQTLFPLSTYKGGKIPKSIWRRRGDRTEEISVLGGYTPNKGRSGFGHPSEALSQREGG